MADEVKAHLNLHFKKGDLSIPFSASLSGIMDGDAAEYRQVIVGTSEEAIATSSDLGFQGYVYVRNLDSTNFVTVGLTGEVHFKLKPGEFCFFYATGDTIYLKADTASCSIEYFMTEA